MLKQEFTLSAVPTVVLNERGKRLRLWVCEDAVPVDKRSYAQKICDAIVGGVDYVLDALCEWATYDELREVQ